MKMRKNFQSTFQETSCYCLQFFSTAQILERHANDD